MSATGAQETRAADLYKLSVPKCLGICPIQAPSKLDVFTESFLYWLMRPRESNLCSSRLFLDFFGPLGAGVGPAAWRLMHPTGRKHLLGVYEHDSFCDPSLKPFIATAADAYCYRVALGDTRALRALRPMALLDTKHRCFASRLKSNYEQIKEKFGRRFKQFEMSSIEAYLLSPLMSPRPKIVRISKAKNPELPAAESISDDLPLPEEPPEPAVIEMLPALVEPVPAAEVAAETEVDTVTPIVRDVVWATPAAYKAGLPAGIIAALIGEPEFAEIAPEGLRDAILMRKKGHCAEGVYLFSETFVKEALETRATDLCDVPVPKSLGNALLMSL